MKEGRERLWSIKIVDGYGIGWHRDMGLRNEDEPLLTSHVL